MALRYAIATGNWNNPAIWDGGTTIPTVGDDVRPNGFTVTINQDITVTTLRTDASSPAVAGGTFIVTGNLRVINANLQVGTSIVLSCSTNINWFLNGNIGAYTAVNISTISMTGGGSFTMVGNVLGNGGASSNGTSIRSTVTMNINITGNVTGGGNSTCHGVAIDLTAGGNINITGNILGGSAVNATGVLLNNSGQILTVNGTITGGTNVNSNFGVQNNAGTLQGNCIAQGASTINGAQGVWANGTNTTTTISEAIYNDNAPTSGKVRFKNINPRVTVVKANGTTQQLVEAGASGDYPVAADVRSGVTYASSSLTGTLIVPSPSNVRKDVATDATVGTADLTAADMWNYLTTNLTTSGSIGERMKNVSTVQTTGDQMSSFNV
jgi:hypothetical protein